jgi:hypothetical protein
LNNLNIQNHIKAKADSYGVCAGLTAGGLTGECLCSVVPGTNIRIATGYCIANISNEIVIVSIPQTDVDMSTYSGTYYIYIVPEKSSYEDGLLTFTNGSKTVTIDADGDFDKLNPYEYLVIIDSLLGNNALYQVSNDIASGTLELSEEFAGTTETDLKWKIAGYFGSVITPTESSLPYEYDKYEVVVSTLPPGIGVANGICLAKAVCDGLGGIVLTDYRNEGNLYIEKQLAPMVADQITAGDTHSVTTIEEKAQAGVVSKDIASFVEAGVRTGLVPALQLDHKTLQIGFGHAFNSDGQRIEILDTGDIYTTDLEVLEGLGTILDGANYCYLKYVSPNSYEFVWNQTGAAETGAVKICKILYDPLAPVNGGHFGLTDQRTFVELKTPSLLLEDKEILPDNAGEIIYYTSGTDASLHGLYYCKGSTAYKIVDKADYLEEVYRFVLYPPESKDFWFFLQGIAAPTFISDSFMLKSFKIAIISTVALVGGNHSIMDILTGIDTGAGGVNPISSSQFILKTKNAENITIANDFTPGAVEFAPNLSFGVYFAGKLSPRVIQLIIGGKVESEIDMEGYGGIPNGGGGTGLNTLYMAEAIIKRQYA